MFFYIKAIKNTNCCYIQKLYQLILKQLNTIKYYILKELNTNYCYTYTKFVSLKIKNYILNTINLIYYILNKIVVTYKNCIN